MADPLKTLGLARRANCVVLGATAVFKAANRGIAVLLLVASDAAQNTVRQANLCAAKAKVPVLVLPFQKSAVGRATGRPECAVAAITDPGFAKAIIKYFPHES